MATSSHPDRTFAVAYQRKPGAEDCTLLSWATKTQSPKTDIPDWSHVDGQSTKSALS
jgi:hypothetical protein